MRRATEGTMLAFGLRPDREPAPRRKPRHPPLDASNHRTHRGLWHRLLIRIGRR